MKKLLTALLAVLLVMSMAACTVNVSTDGLNVGKATTAAPAGTTAPKAEAAATEAATEAATTPVTEAPVQTPTEPAQVETEPVATDPAVAADGLTLGTYSGNSYVNEFLGIELNMPAGYVFDTLSTVKSDNGLSASLSGDALNAEVQKLSYVYLGGAEDSVGNSIYLSATRNDSGYTEEEYLDELKAQLEISLTNVGATNLTFEDGFVNDIYPGILTTCNYNGGTIYTINFCWLVDDYIVTGQVTAEDMGTMDVILECLTIR